MATPWLGLVRTRASVLADDERLIQQTVTLTVDLLAGRRPIVRLPRRPVVGLATWAFASAPQGVVDLAARPPRPLATRVA